MKPMKIYICFIIGLLIIGCSNDDKPSAPSDIFFKWNYISGDSTVMLITNVTNTFDDILIEWVTFGETNFDSYEIKYWQDDRYKIFGIVGAHGTNPDTLNYSYYSLLEFNTTDTVKFRIQAIHYDGTKEWAHYFDVAWR